MIMKNSNALDQLFANNREWAEAMIANDANFFKRLVSQQAPEYLWIGCSDSRVPANEIVNLLPGELFVHRNVANVVVHTDLNCLSVIQFAIDLLQVKHILVVGHYGCSGVHTAMTDRRVGLADNWLRHVKDVHQKHERYLGDAIPTAKRQDRLCELNVIEQVVNVCETTIVQDAWARGQDLTVHGWTYRLESGLVNDLGMSISSAEEMHVRYAKSLSRYDTE
ncbi:MAG: carbonate dehydratase [Polynucleobacter sp. 24-46-87]|jgi:carbonic anhydrase|uniref:carbonate dehydratase n=1 Tax=Polynucleobacter sp. 39-46-10 TaxID=1970428 RepID=UPI000BDCA73B|nr:carbonate dehydratase [Polynucleobacter sp. 39-46-10]OZA15800.1 MAG: carbonate dehydratase [Polynucleobacter sp. 24-46-87]OZA76916.1 MAG: carbonate dehydratase [Polynucleobacter sp. 39-46-10]